MGKRSSSIQEGLHRNPDGSYEGFLDAATANKMLVEWINMSTEYAVRAVQKRDERILQMIGSKSDGKVIET